MIRCPVIVTVRLDRGTPTVHVTLRIDNRGSGHRLRARFDLHGSGDRLKVHSVFDLVDRTPVAIDARSNGIRAEQFRGRPAGMIGYLLAGSGQAGLALAGEGVYEYEHHPSLRAVDLTLLRSVDAINMGFEAWEPGVGGSLIGEHEVCYAVTPFAGDAAAYRVTDEVEASLHPVASAQFAEGLGITHTGPSWDDPRLKLSAFKVTEDDAAQLLRLYNISDELVKTTLHFGRRYREVACVRLDEQEPQKLAERADSIELKVPPKKIISLRLTPEIPN